MHSGYRSHLRLGALALLAVAAYLAPAVEAFNLFGTPKAAGVATGSVGKVMRNVTVVD